MGGEKGKSQQRIQNTKGSPPRGRGKEVSNLDDAKKIRITPAWAGKRRRNLSMWSGCWDHPRVGGEKTKKIP